MSDQIKPMIQGNLTEEERQARYDKMLNALMDVELQARNGDWIAVVGRLNLAMGIARPLAGAQFEEVAQRHILQIPKDLAITRSEILKKIIEKGDPCTKSYCVVDEDENGVATGIRIATSPHHSHPTAQS